MKAHILLILMFLLPFTAALEQTDEYYVFSSRVFVKTTIKFDEPFNGTMQLNIPEDSSAGSMYVDSEIIEFSDSLNLKSATGLNYEYTTKLFSDKGNFVGNIKASYDIDILNIKLVLEENGRIDKSVGSGTFPLADKMTTDGENIILLWQEKDIMAGSEFPIYVRIKPQQQYGIYLVFLTILVILAYLVHIFWKIPLKTEIKKQGTEESESFKTLKEDELQVARVLKLKEGSCEQGTLRIATGFSKAKLSRLLMEMEERKIIYKEQRGKKNVIFLK